MVAMITVDILQSYYSRGREVGPFSYLTSTNITCRELTFHFDKKSHELNSSSSSVLTSNLLLVVVLSKRSRD